MRRYVVDAIKDGDWEFEPQGADGDAYEATRAMPGTREKIEVLATRARDGLPLWHDRDRTDYDEDLD